MVIYHVGHHMFLHIFFMHKINYYKQEKAVFLYDLDMNQKNSQINQFVEKIRDSNPYGQLIPYHNISILKKSVSNEDCKNRLVEMFDNIFNEKNICINGDTVIYNSFDEFNSFGAYLYYKGWKSYSVVGQSGIYGEHGKRIVDLAYRHCQFVGNIYRELKAYENNSMINKIFFVCSITDNDPTNSELWNVKSWINELNEEEKNNILSIFDVTKLNVNKEKNYLLVTCGRWFINNLDMYQVNYLSFYQQLIDYFGDNKNVALKPHPRYEISIDECLDNFNNTILIPAYIPSDLLDAYDEIKISSVLDVCSAAVRGLSKPERKIIYFDWWYINEKSPGFRLINKLYITFKLADYMSITNVRYYGIAKELLDRIVEYWYEFDFKSVEWFMSSWGLNKVFNLPLNTMYVIGDIEWQKNIKPELEFDSFINAVNSNRNDILYVMFDIKRIKDAPEFIANKRYVYCIELKKEKIRDTILCSLVQEYIYIFCRNEMMIKRLSEFMAHKTLHNMGIRIKCDNIQRL